MAGTNDLFDAASTEAQQEILDNLLRLHQLCHSHGAATVALGVPPHPMERQKVLVGRVIRAARAFVNEGLQKACEDTTWLTGVPAPGVSGEAAAKGASRAGTDCTSADTRTTRDGIRPGEPLWVDTESLVPYFDRPTSDRDRVWGGLHMTQAGYAELGEKLATLLLACGVANDEPVA